MKRLAVSSLALFPLLALAAPKEGVYVAATLEPFNKTDVKIQQVGSVSGDNDFGYSLILGYDHLLDENITLGVSGEYNNLGEATTYPVSWSASGFSITVRPKIYFGDSDIYISPYVGVGKYEFEISESITGSRETSNETAYKYGIEIGAQFDENFIVNAGWKESYYDEHGVSIDIHGLYLGAGYRF